MLWPMLKFSFADEQTNRQGKNYMLPIYRCGGHKNELEKLKREKKKSNFYYEHESPFLTDWDDPEIECKHLESTWDVQ